jgi:hypothetical protein
VLHGLDEPQRRQLAAGRGLLCLRVNTGGLGTSAKRLGIDLVEGALRHSRHLRGRSETRLHQRGDFVGAVGDAADALDGLDLLDSSLGTFGIEPFADNVKRAGRISFGVSSYGYDLRVGTVFKIFTNINSEVVDPKHFSDRSFVTIDTDETGKDHVLITFQCTLRASHQRGN